MACVITDKSSALKNENQICGTFPELINSKIIFEGSGNILFCEKGVRLKNSVLTFQKSGSVIYLSSNHHTYLLNVSIQYDSTFFMGADNYMSGSLHVIFSEQKNIVIGDGCLFSFGIYMRLADSHLIYDIETHRRINPSKSIYIGDHVWIGQNVLLLRGTRIGSGCIIGASSVAAGGKTLPSNTVWAGSPIRKVRSNIFWDEKCVHGYREEDTKACEFNPTEDFIYEEAAEQTLPFDKIEESLNSDRTPDERLAYLGQALCGVKNKNRFYIGE